MRTRFSRFALGPFGLWLEFFKRRRLAGIYVRGVEHLAEIQGNVVLAANHVSWWDGFLLFHLYRKVNPGCPLHTIMLESQLRRYPFFRLLGAVGVVPGDVSSTASAVRYLVNRTARGRIWVSMFPQGAIWPSIRRPLGFQPGVAKLAQLLIPAVIVPVGIHVEPLHHTRPSGFITVGAGVPAHETITAADIEERVARLLDGVHDILNTHGERAPAAFVAATKRAATQPQ